MRSNKPNAEPFQDYVQEELLPNIRKQIIESYMMENVSLKNDMRQLITQVNDIKTQNSELISQNRMLMGQNQETHEKLDEMNDKFDIVVEERAPYPSDHKKTERFILLKRNNDHYPYYAIRAQQQACKTALRKQEREYGSVQVLLDFDTHPNTKTFYNRIKLNLRREGVKFSSNQVRIEEGSEMSEDRLIEELRRIDEEKRDV